MRWLADLIYLVTGLLYLPVALYQAIVQGKNRTGWRERFGGVPVSQADTPRIWVHAVSLGEVNATPLMIEMLRERIPGCDIVVSTTTDTGFARAVSLFGRANVFRFPLDFSLAVERALDRVQPSLIVLMELEVWYNLVRRATLRGVPVAVVNGRLTEHSARRFARFGSLVRPMFSSLSWVGAQDEDIAQRFRRLGVRPDRVEVTSSLKWDSAGGGKPPPSSTALTEALGIARTDSIWVCGSTGPGEEALLLDAYDAITCASASPNAVGCGVDPNPPQGATVPRLVIVPRKPERFDEVALLIEQRGYRCVRRSTHPDGTPAERRDGRTPPVILGDTMGELRTFYARADVVFVGRSLVPLGGSDPMEVAALAKPLVVGPYTDNFRAPVRAFQDGQALRVVQSAGELARQVAALLADDAERSLMGRRAREVLVAHQGATERTVARLVDLMKKQGAGRPLSRVADR